MTDEQKEWIDTATYEQLLFKWRFAPVSDPLLQSEVGEYFRDVMFKRRSEVGDAAHVRASKNIGWEKI